VLIFYSVTSIVVSTDKKTAVDFTVYTTVALLVIYTSSESKSTRIFTKKAGRTGGQALGTGKRAAGQAGGWRLLNAVSSFNG
jgi:hypothetical protein